MADRDRNVPAQTSAHEVEEFLRKVAVTPAPVRAGGRGRLIFAIDATASREPTSGPATKALVTRARIPAARRA